MPTNTQINTERVAVQYTTLNTLLEHLETELYSLLGDRKLLGYFSSTTAFPYVANIADYSRYETITTIDRFLS